MKKIVYPPEAGIGGLTILTILTIFYSLVGYTVWNRAFFSPRYACIMAICLRVHVYNGHVFKGDYCIVYDGHEVKGVMRIMAMRLKVTIV